MEAFLKAKHSVIQIKNTDKLCCAQAIVTMKACLHKGDNVDGRHLYENLRDGYQGGKLFKPKNSIAWLVFPKDRVDYKNWKCFRKL